MKPNPSGCCKVQSPTCCPESYPDTLKLQAIPPVGSCAPSATISMRILGDRTLPTWRGQYACLQVEVLCAYDWQDGTADWHIFFSNGAGTLMFGTCHPLYMEIDFPFAVMSACDPECNDGINFILTE
ncbi:hypothetical protein [Planctomicrobium sp. SH527]|uniref:hypothetical protein n=1 Tax=Planctomicrobium sp. SH527 TaxID=3448123 RepID=UPI003F5C788A